MEAAARFLVVGRVQGVCFRAGTREQALRLGLRGHARNLPDGSVEVVAAGEAGALEALAGWLREGPPMARVDGVTRSEAGAGGIGEGFTIG
ncbi:MAG TPA: acylphosphatase [Luteimonas sp.]|nr:acylphosphatase [Luteimonas sp.]